MQWTSAGGHMLRLMTGDITRVPVDAIANAANEALVGGGGVDGAIHRAGGPEIMADLDRIRPLIGGRCRTGSAVATTAGLLPAKWVFHTAGPIYRGGGHGEAQLLAACYRTCLQLAEERGVKRISFPAISAGIYGYPLEEAARIAIDTVARHLETPGTTVEEAIFVLFDTRAYNAFAAALQER